MDQQQQVTEREQQVTERVSAGMAWIIATAPRVGWDLDRINVETLDITSATECVVAQAAATDYHDAMDHAAATAPPGDDMARRWVGYADGQEGWEAARDWEISHGLVAPWSYAGYRLTLDLTASEWRRAILAWRTASEWRRASGEAAS